MRRVRTVHQVPFCSPQNDFDQSNTMLKHALLFVLMLLCLRATAQSAENCANNIDDDADGLIDCFDPDCGCSGPCVDYYYNTCPTSCFYHPPCDQITLGIDWVGDAEVGTYSTLVAGDLDRDGIPEVVTYNVESTEIYIINGATGKTKYTIQCASDIAGGTSPAIADLDNDGFGEIILVANDRRLRCWSHLGILKWVGPTTVGYDTRYRFSSPSIADFDHNGWPEICIGNQVFSGTNGALLASGGPGISAGEHPARVANGFSFNASVPMDVLPDSACPDCAGLEIVAGNQVLSVNLVTNSVKVVKKAPSNYSDGFTSVADLDRDGDLDAVVQGRKNGWNTVYGWDLTSGLVLGEYRLQNNWAEGASRVNIADMNNDGQLDLNFISFPRMYTLRGNFTLLWMLNNDDVSAVTSSSVFDFCGDGSSDILYRGQTKLQVIEGATGAIKWEDDCASYTHIECPLILDVDGDGQTEVVISCGVNGNPGKGRVVSYETVNTPGIASRPVWNQHAYFNTNIEDDLSVPRYQQNPHLVADGLKLNGFMNQYFNPTFPAPDASLEVNTVSCLRDSFVVTATVCNTGQNLLPGTTPISFYAQNPTKGAATWFFTTAIGVQLPFDSCATIQLTIPRVANVEVFAILNDDASLPAPFSLDQQFPVTGIGECNFMNNLDSFYFAYAPAPLHLGTDTLICDNASILLDVSDSFTNTYLWHNGSHSPTFTVRDAGIFHVTTTDICLIQKSDTLVVGIDSSTVVQLGPDQVLCAGETFSLSAPGFDFYVWQPVSAMSCATCSDVIISPHASANVILTASLNNGCWSSDTLQVTVYDTTYQVIDTTICYGLEVQVNGITLPPDTTVLFALQSQYGCDSTVVYRVIGTQVGTYRTMIDTTVCKGSLLTYAGVTLSEQDSYQFNLTAKTGCDSTVIVRTTPIDTFYTRQLERICYGASIQIFGQIQNQSGLYSRRFIAANGCDSTHVVELVVAEQIQPEGIAEPSCPDEPTGSLAVQINGGTSPYSLQWDQNGLYGNQLSDLEPGVYSLTVTDGINCTQTAAFTIGSHPEMVWESQVVDPLCYGQSSGRILIISQDSSLLFSLNDGAFGPARVFDHQPAGVYKLVAQDVHGCTESRPSLLKDPAELLVKLGDQTIIHLGDSLQLESQANTNAALTYTWAPPLYLSCHDCPSPISKPFYPVRYLLTVTDQNGCTATASQMVDVDRSLYHYAPNVIAPDATYGNNAAFMPYFDQAVEQVLSFEIFDRWGNAQYRVENIRPDDQQMLWNARVGAKSVLPGVYIWAARIRLVDGTKTWVYGDVSVVR